MRCNSLKLVYMYKRFPIWAVNTFEYQHLLHLRFFLLRDLLLEAQVNFDEALSDDDELVDSDLCRLLFFAVLPRLGSMGVRDPSALGLFCQF